ncbi:MAG: hypothetical protein WDM79_02925 [Terricaulis sp.]
MAKIREIDLDRDDALYGAPANEAPGGFLIGMIIGAALIALGVFFSTQSASETFGVDAPRATAQFEQGQTGS